MSELKKNDVPNKVTRGFLLGRRIPPLADSSPAHHSPESNFLTRSLNRILPRRELLTKAGLAGVIAYSSLIESSNIPWLRLAERFFASKSDEELVSERKVVYSKTQLFTEDQDTLGAGSRNHKTAYVITHAGYTEYHLARERARLGETFLEEGEQFGKEWEKLLDSTEGGFYGDYKSYLNVMTRLVSSLNRSGQLVIFALEETDFYNPAIPRPNLLPGKNARLIVSDNHTGNFTANEVQTLEGSVKQSPDVMLNLLKEVGVEEVRVAGEWSFNEENLACLGGIANLFRGSGFKVKGIDGAIFPNLKPEDIKPQPKDREMLRELYVDTVPLSEVLI